MRFSYAPEIRSDFPDLATHAIMLDGITPQAWPEGHIALLWTQAARRLETGQEGSFAEITAWRQAFSRMGLKPSQYRCAAEALLRRFRRERLLPAIHPLVDLCNAVSLAHAIPIAVFDLSCIQGSLQVRPATGQESYHAFDGTQEQPDAGEVIFADDAGLAHARRWCNRQSAASAVCATTRSALIVAEALHARATADLARLAEVLQLALAETWPQARLQQVETA